MIARLALRFLLLFAAVLLALSAGAYIFLGREYAALLAPALSTPEGTAAYAAAMRKVAITLAAFDVPLLAVFGAVSWALARASLEPLVQAQERERAFAADAAHALRSPLATIAALAQTGASTTQNQSVQTFDTIARAALDASATVGDLLTLARAARSDVLVREPVDIAALLCDVAREFEMQASQRGIELRCSTASAIVEADERRIRELARNLIENALRHARTCVTIDVRANGRDAEVAVWNDGEAVEPQAKEKVFQRFYRGDRHAGGSGLGLAIVAWVARAHGGSASVRDGAAGGAEFVVRLPLFALE